MTSPEISMSPALASSRRLSPDAYVILIFPNVKIEELLLNGWLGEQCDIEVLGIELKVIGRIRQRSLDSLKDDRDRGIRRVYFVQNQNPSDGFDLRGGNALSQKTG